MWTKEAVQFDIYGFGDDPFMHLIKDQNLLGCYILIEGDMISSCIHIVRQYACISI